jgi:lysozyme
MLDMSIKSDLMNDVRADEGIRLFVYDDATGLPITPGYTVKGHPTIGVGRALDAHGISGYEANVMLDNDCTNIISWADETYSWFETLSPLRRRVICNMIFQIGALGFQKFTTFITAIEQAQWNAASAAMLDSLWARKQTPERASRLATWFLNDSIQGQNNQVAS